ncbi:polysaccharide deacetylase family protein [Aquimarina sp. AU119]|uniref:polysaccharide deacetylase family protein n=1 Tax=Aquimarina sp. AU119 TaxID=2108528 RepID=UPI001356E94E|nr:polysaccharide deacetylase family protein [Aquimarina sp. AU119]
MKNILLFIILLISIKMISQPTISFTFDDGITEDRCGYSFKDWNAMLLGHLEKANIKTIFFVTGKNKIDENGKFLLNSWNEKGHRIGNHTYTHPYYNSEKVSFNDFSQELIKTDKVINSYSNYIRLFRFPYLKEGNTQGKVDSIRQFLKEKKYKNGHVTIDASDWYIDSRLRKRLKENSDANIEGFKNFYLQHIFERATFYENLSYKMTGRHINHTLLLHHNLTAALFLDDLIQMFKEKGWNIIPAEEAYKDPIFNKSPNHAGESLIWALAKDSGDFEEILRYPAEDSRYEKNKMDHLGL